MCYPHHLTLVHLMFNLTHSCTHAHARALCSAPHVRHSVPTPNTSRPDKDLQRRRGVTNPITVSLSVTCGCDDQGWSKTVSQGNLYVELVRNAYVPYLCVPYILYIVYRIYIYIYIYIYIWKNVYMKKCTSTYTDFTEHACSVCAWFWPAL
jgi:hypothetical protein